MGGLGWNAEVSRLHPSSQFGHTKGKLERTWITECHGVG
jgi:hypothetical protein